MELRRFPFWLGTILWAIFLLALGVGGLVIADRSGMPILMLPVMGLIGYLLRDEFHE